MAARKTAPPCFRTRALGLAPLNPTSGLNQAKHKLRYAFAAEAAARSASHNVGSLCRLGKKVGIAAHPHRSGRDTPAARALARRP